jgi:hypothetical protein
MTPFLRLSKQRAFVDSSEILAFGKEKRDGFQTH